MTAEQFILDYYNAPEFEDIRDETTQRWDSLANCMEEYHQAKLKLLGIGSVSNRFSDDKFITNVCLSYDHSFGLMTEEERKKVVFDCKEWMRAIKNNEPY